MVELKDTLLMPKTDFPMRGNLPNKEPNFLKRWEEMDLYRKVYAKNHFFDKPAAPFTGI